jgi:hypothetical protein
MPQSAYRFVYFNIYCKAHATVPKSAMKLSEIRAEEQNLEQ